MLEYGVKSDSEPVPTTAVTGSPSDGALASAPSENRNESRAQPIVKKLRAAGVDLEDQCLQMVASSVASREIPPIAMVALQECLPEGNGM